MGGFAGGDEGGYWDIDIPPNAMFKKNEKTSKNSNGITSYIERNDSGYTIKAYAKDKAAYDTISFVPCECETLTIEGYDEISLSSNSIYIAYKALMDFTDDLDIEDFFYTHKVLVTEGAVSTSSHAAAFILLVKEACNLILSMDELESIGSSVDDDVTFFIHNYYSDDSSS
jgi:4-diphosphocytidyl-2C-methyl-D-erythritol kinase